MLEIGIVILLVTAVIIVGISYILSYGYKNGINGKTTTRGMNGLASTKLELACPAGQVINFDSYNSVISRGVLFCSASSKGENSIPPQRSVKGNASLDGFYQQGKGQNKSFFNPNTTIDLTSSDSPFSLVNCKGKNSCSFTVPDVTDPNIGVLAGCSGTIAMVGTYDCVAAN